MRFKRIRKISAITTFEIKRLSESELKKLVMECQGLTKTNCGWIMYGLKEIVIKVAKTQLRWLKLQKARKAPKRKTSPRSGSKKKAAKQTKGKK